MSELALISELILGNGQRSGVISCIITAEVEKARNDATPEIYHRLKVSNHKTGFQQAAISFLYPELFRGLDKFLNCILPNLPIHLGKDNFPTPKETQSNLSQVSIECIDKVIQNAPIFYAR